MKQNILLASGHVEAIKADPADRRYKAAEPSVVLENAKGVQIREDVKFNGHYGASNATCEAGDELIVAPMLFHADHKKGDPVMVCGDHGVHCYRFSDLVQGPQPAGEQP